MNLEHRTVHAEVRTSSDEPGLFEAKVMRYGILDDYKTIFDPEVFRDSLAERLPAITWGHVWTDPLGRYVDYKDTREALSLVGQLDLEMIEGTNIPAVPRAHQARVQLRSKTITDFSVGFRRDEGGVYRDDNDIEHFRSARLDEVALVLSGAVPGTELVSVRQPIRRLVSVRSGLMVPVETLIEVARLKAAGELTDEEAVIALDLASGAAVPASDAAGSIGDGAGESAGTDPGPDPTEQAAAAVLEALGFG